MPTFRVKKSKDYTVVNNTHIRDRRLSLKAKGLLELMLALPDEWDYSVKGLMSLCNEKESALTSALRELSVCGYLVVEKQFPNETESGRIEYSYTIYEQPQKQGVKKQGVEKQGLENQGLEIQGLENPRQLNTNKISTKESSTKKSNNKPPKDDKFIPPTVEEVSAYCKGKGYDVDPERFVSFYASKGWKVGKNSMVNWKAAIVGWVKRDEESNKKPKHFNGERQYDDDFFKRLEERDK